MNWVHKTLSSAVALAWLCGSVQAEGVPPSVTQALQERDKALSHTTFHWQRAAKEQVFCSLTPTELATMRRKMEVSDEADYRKRGITDNARIKRDIEFNTRSVMTALKGGSVAYTNVWSFQRDGAGTLVSGTTQQFTGFVGTFRQVYDGNDAMTVFDESHSSTDGSPLPTIHPVAWRTSGESIYFPASSSANLELSPEHLACLLGSNPLALRGLQWTLRSQTPTELVLNSSFLDEHTPCTIQMTLAPKNGFAPSEIIVQSRGSVERFTASHFRLYKSIWVSDVVSYFKDAPRFVRESQVWRLQSLTPSTSIEVKIASSQPVRDFRLLGPDLSSRTLDRAGMRANKQFGKILQYRWTGHFPSEQELKQLYQKENPGEGLADPDQSTATPPGLNTPAARASLTSSALPFAGGFLCLAGGAWMFQHRRAK